MTDDAKRAEELARKYLEHPSCPCPQCELSLALLASLERERRAPDEALERAANLVESRGREYVDKWAEMELDEQAKVYGWDSLQHAIAIRALKSDAGAAKLK